jgi:uncharacterized membrane protein YkvA (DUF1232 family)
VSPWLTVLLSALAGVLLLWGLAVVVLLLARPSAGRLTEAVRLLPDLLRLVTRLARDPELPRGIRVRLWLLLAYLALPIDLIPDFVPVLGYADDAVIVTLVMRSVLRRAGPDALARHWPGTEDGLTAVLKLAA